MASNVHVVKAHIRIEDVSERDREWARDISKDLSERLGRHARRYNGRYAPITLYKMSRAEVHFICWLLDRVGYGPLTPATLANVQDMLDFFARFQSDEHRLKAPEPPCQS